MTNTQENIDLKEKILILVQIFIHGVLVLLLWTWHKVEHHDREPIRQNGARDNIHHSKVYF